MLGVGLRQIPNLQQRFFHESSLTRVLEAAHRTPALRVTNSSGSTREHSGIRSSQRDSKAQPTELIERSGGAPGIQAKACLPKLIAPRTRPQESKV